MKKYLSLIAIFILVKTLVAQTSVDLSEAEIKITALAKQMHTDTSLSSRESYANEIKLLLLENLKEKGSFEYNFDNLIGVSMLKSSDNRFKIFTWELFVNKDTYKQFGVLQTNDEKIYPLEDKSETMVRAEFSRLKPENWYGALYYHIQPFKTANGETQYLLLGRDSYGYYERRKVVEILYFDFMDRPRFGNNVIQVKDGRGQLRNVNRYFVQYATSAAVTLRYDNNLKMVVFDHLIAEKPLVKGAPLSYIPDGSFNGLKEVKGKWEFVDMVFEYNSENVLENAVNPHEVMMRNDKKRDGNKDILGREIKNK